MSDLIDRHAALEAVSSEPLYKTGLKRRYADEVVPAIYEKIKALQPTAEPVRHGKWIDKYNGIEGAWSFCSVCGERAIDLYDFCPYCGARMDKDE